MVLTVDGTISGEEVLELDSLVVQENLNFNFKDEGSFHDSDILRYLYAGCNSFYVPLTASGSFLAFEVKEIIFCCFIHSDV